MNSKETLFSLELAVESLRIHSSTTVCRLPTVAFRLLDFPTLLIHHIDPHEAERIKDAVLFDSFGDIPNQLQELRDHRGNFRINKCKSSLFKMNPEMLLAYLRNTPLYLMLIDVWPEVPKLVANCTVSLQDIMEKISEDIEQNGIDVPSVHGHRDSHKLYNLMGSEVGWVIVRYRLLSVGASLIPHIPEAAVAKRGTESVDLTVMQRNSKDGAVDSDAKISNKGKDVVLEDLEVHGKDHPKTISVAISTADDFCSNLEVEQSDKQQKATQTEMHSKQASHHKKAASSLMPLTTNDDLVINNTHCPPPLFFNIASEDRAASQRQCVNMIRGNIEHINTYKYNAGTCVSDPRSTHDGSVNSSLLSSQTLSEDIRHETEMHYKYPSTDLTISPGWSVRKTHRTFRMEKSKEKAGKHRPVGLPPSDTIHEMKEKHQLGPQMSVPICNRCQLEVDPSYSRLPLLGALLQELSLLHGNALHQREPITSPKTLSQKVKICTSSKHQIADASRITARDEKENISISASKDELKAKPYRHKHRECAKPPKSVPPTKGWLRQQQPVQKPKHGSMLQYAMTHSQKLRLRKNNPEVLKEMELKESRIQELQREKERRKLMKREEKDFAETANERDVSTEIAQHYDGEDAKLIPPTYQKRSSIFEEEKDITGENADHCDWSKGAAFTTKQPHVVAPRRPKASTYVWGNDDAYPNTEAENGLKSLAENEKQEGSRTKDGQVGDIGRRRDSRDSEEPKDMSNSEKSARSIAIYLPSASVHESDSGSNSDNDSQISSGSSYVKQPKAVRVPGLPSDQDVSDEDSHSESNMQYSDDFIESDDLGSTGERELAPLKSTWSDSYHSVHTSTSEESKSSSVGTTKSQISVVSSKTKSPDPRLGGKPNSSQPRRLSIPKPKLSSISPVPVRKSSKTSSTSITTATALTPNLPPRDTEHSVTPPTPKPRSSLLKSASRFSETSLLQSTVPSSEFKTEDSQKASQKESNDSYSFNFENSGVISTQSDTF